MTIRPRARDLTRLAVGRLGCTSIVAQSSNGTVYHARNQDYPLRFAKTTIEVDFYRGGSRLYTSTIFAGSEDISGSALRAGGWSFSINERKYTDTNTPAALERTLAVAAAGGLPAIVVARMAMEKSGAQQLSTYASALQYLSSTPLLIPNFFALAGTRSGEGAILTRDPEAGKAEVVALGTAQLGGESWFVAVTNSDITIQPNFSNPDSRIAATLTHMKAVGAANVDLQALWDVLSKPPVFASDTLHTELMLPASGEYTTRLRVHQLQ